MTSVTMPCRRRAALAVVLTGTCVALCHAAPGAAPATGESPGAAHPGARPNIVVVLADDMGFSDIGPYGSEISTPTLDRLAAGGIRFRQFYNNAKCSPTRASLLTGLYPHEAGMGDLADGRPRDAGPYQGYLPDHVTTIASALRSAGYRTIMSGKWHLGDYPEHWPKQRGFDRYFGLISGATSYFELLPEPGRIRRMALEDTPWAPEPGSFYATDAYTDYAVGAVEEHRRAHPDQPFFLYLAYTAPHFPLHALPEDIQKYAHRYDAGWDALRAERYERMRLLNVIGDRHANAPRPSTVPAWTTTADTAGEARRMAVYAAMVDRMDQGIGRLLAALERTGAADNTLVLFLSDNGGTAEDVGGRGLNDPSVAVGARGSYAAYREPWAYASNTPFRLYKNWLHEGGIATPLIAWWPSGIRRPGRLSDAVGHVIDIYPTLLDVAGVRPPAGSAAPAGSPRRQGRSFAPVLRDGVPPPRGAPLFWAYGGNWAVRDGHWKLVYDGTRAKREELFDLSTDPTELHDVSQRFPVRVKSMRQAWLAWATRVGARERTTVVP